MHINVHTLVYNGYDDTYNPTRWQNSNFHIVILCTAQWLECWCKPQGKGSNPSRSCVCGMFPCGVIPWQICPAARLTKELNHAPL